MCEESFVAGAGCYIPHLYEYEKREEARAVCQSQGAELAVLETEEEWNLLQGMRVYRENHIKRQHYKNKENVTLIMAIDQFYNKQMKNRKQMC